MKDGRRGFLRLVGGAVVSLPAIGAAAACTADPGATAGASPTPGPEPVLTFPPGDGTSSGTNIPRLAEGGRLARGTKRHHLEVIWEIDTREKVVALTFDDGPDPAVSAFLYEALEEAKVGATFFMVGRRVLDNAKLLSGRMHRHEVGNHTFDHTSLFLQDQTAIRKNLLDAHGAITSVVGREPTLLRPPYSHVNGNTLLAAAEIGYDIVMWNQYIGDQAYVNDEDKLVADVIAAITPGSIVLAHDSGASRMIAIRNVPKIIRELKRRKYEFVTVSQLRAAKA
jgi:peptidoglycan/xylan/chitin deacetylase (PgdA/CDA1 family)